MKQSKRNKRSTIKNSNDQQNISSSSYKIRSRNTFNKIHQQTCNCLSEMRLVIGIKLASLYELTKQNTMCRPLYTIETYKRAVPFAKP